MKYRINLIIFFAFFCLKANAQLIISEVADPNDNADGRFVELYNAGATTIDFSEIDYYIVKQNNGGNNFYHVKLYGNVEAGATYLISNKSEETFFSIYDVNPDKTASNAASGNGDDAYMIYKNGYESSGELLDIYGRLNENGTGKEWEYTDGRAVRNANILAPNTTWTSSEWTIEADPQNSPQNVADMTPKVHNQTQSQILVSTNTLNNFGDVIINQNSSVQFYTIIANNLTDNITITPPTNFKISTDNINFTSSNIILNHENGEVLLTTIYVKFYPISLGEKTEFITHNSNNATNQNIQTQGNCISQPTNLETFENLNATPSYETNFFIGNDNIKWNYIISRGEGNFAIYNKGLILKSNIQNSSCYAENLSNGIANFSVQFRKAYIGNGERQIEIFINDVSKGISQIIEDDENLGTITNFEINNINIEGDFSIKILNKTENQVTIDNISWTNYQPPHSEIIVEGNNYLIEHNNNIPNLIDNTDFGEKNISDENIIKTFKIKNIGDANLILNNNSSIEIQGVHADNFQVQTLPSLNIASSTSSEFSIVFNPNTVGTSFAKVKIFSNDENKNSYIFNIKAKLTNNSSNENDIISLGNESENIFYANNTNEIINNINDAQKVWSFQIRDGGENDDDDNLSTNLLNLTIEKGENNSVENWLQVIKKAILFDGENKISEANITDEKIIFENLSIEILDNSSKNLDLYLSFNTENIIDNQSFQFQISQENLHTTLTSSSFSDFTSFSESGKNIIEIEANHLEFSQNLAENIYTNLEFSAEIMALDNFNNLDKDANNIIILSKNTGEGVLSSANNLTQNLSNGVYKWEDLNINEAGILKLLISENESNLTSKISNEINVTYLNTSPTNKNLIITEVNSHENAGANYVEIFNNTNDKIYLDNIVFEHYNNNASSTTARINLSGILDINQCIIIAKVIDNFKNYYPNIEPDYILSSLYLNGGKDRLLLKTNDGTLIDKFNMKDGEDISIHHLYYRKGIENEGVNLSNDWLIIGENNLGTPKERNEFLWCGNENNDFHNTENWFEKAIPNNESAIILNSLNQPIISQNIDLKNLLIKENSSLTINENVQLTVKNTLQNDDGINGLILKSSELGDASLLHYSLNISAFVEKKISNNRWHYISLPVENIDILNSIESNNILNIYAKYFNIEDGSWEYINQSNSTILNKKTGYCFWASENDKFYFKGVLNSGNQNLIVHKNTNSNGWNFIGNPYTCAINWNDLNLNESNLNNAIYFWNGTNYSTYLGGTNPSSINGGTNIIPSMQGFFVQCLSDDGGNFNFTDESKLHSSQTFFKKNDEKPKNNLLIIAENDNLKDETIIRFLENASDGFDKNLDAKKMLTNSNPNQVQIFTGDNLAINSLSNFEIETKINFSIFLEKFKNLSLSFKNLESFDDNISIFLEDKNNKKFINCRKHFNYMLTEKNTNTYDFNLHFFKKQDDLTEKKVLVYACQNQIIIKSFEEILKDVKCEVFDLMGRKIQEIKIDELELFTFSLYQKGIFLIRLTTNEKTILKKIYL